MCSFLLLKVEWSPFEVLRRRSGTMEEYEARTNEHRENQLCTITQSRKYLVLPTYLTSGIRPIYTMLYLVVIPGPVPILSGQEPPQLEASLGGWHISSVFVCLRWSECRHSDFWRQGTSTGRRSVSGRANRLIPCPIRASPSPAI